MLRRVLDASAPSDALPGGGIHSRSRPLVGLMADLLVGFLVEAVLHSLARLTMQLREEVLLILQLLLAFLIATSRRFPRSSRSRMHWLLQRVEGNEDRCTGDA